MTSFLGSLGGVLFRKAAAAARAARVGHGSGVRALAGCWLLVTLMSAQPAAALDAPSGTAARQQADFAGEGASAEARELADWVVAAADNRGLPFIVVDKRGAKLFLFDPHGAVRAATPVLLGRGRGDVSPPGIGDRKLSQIKPAERITPAGRFLASPGENLSGEDILWLDYDAAISLHRATDIKPGLTRRDRLARLASATPHDNRISHGCINVSADFYDGFIRATFRASQGVVYVLPEGRSLREVFPLRTPAPQAQQAQQAQRSDPAAAMGG